MGVLTFAALSYLSRTIYRRLDKYGIFDVATNGAHRGTTWIEGLRGICALGIVATNIAACCTDPSIRNSNSLPPPVKPYRLLTTENGLLAMLFMLWAFVFALGPLQLVQSGSSDLASANLRRFLFSSPIRLFLSGTIITCASSLLCQLGAYAAARETGQALLRAASPTQSSSLSEALTDLFWSLIATWWPGPSNLYEPMQDALLGIIQGGCVLCLVLFPFINLRKWVRVTIAFAVMYLYFDSLAGPAFLSGLLLAELWTSRHKSRLERVPNLLASLLAAGGVAILLFTNRSMPSITWIVSARAGIMRWLPPSFVPDTVSGIVGGALITLATMSSQETQKALSHPFLIWLGRLAFPIYLLHMIVLRLFMPWLIYISNPIQGILLLDKSGEGGFRDLVVKPSKIREALSSIVLIVLTLTIAHQWVCRIEPRITQASQAAEILVFGKPNLDDTSKCNGCRDGKLPIYHEKDRT